MFWFFGKLAFVQKFCYKHKRGIIKMKEVFTMWKNTKMVVLTAICGAVYAAVLIPFKPIPLIPGFTEIRPASVLPVVFSLFFGPAGAWGSAFGNLIGDFFGTLGIGSIFGFFGNFLYGYLPCKVWSYLSPQTEPLINHPALWLKYIFTVLIASLGCAIPISWGIDWVGLIPFSVLANIIFLNNFFVSLILGPILLFTLYPRFKKWNLLYSQIGEITSEKTFLQNIGFIFILIGCFGGLLVGNLTSLGHFTGKIGINLIPLIFSLILGTILI